MRAVTRVANLAGAFLAGTAVLILCAQGAGRLPALGPAFNPGTGVWTAAIDAVPAHNETLPINGLRQPAQVLLEANGVAHVVAATDPDLFTAIGYLHARFRLQQMDLLRRQGEGLLSEVVGPRALDSDRVELEIGLARTAAAEWAQADEQTRGVLRAYAVGVNDRIHEERRAHSLPMSFRLLGYEPRDWTPIDTLVVKGIMTQSLDLQDTPVSYAQMVDALGYARTMSWLPVQPPNEQHPYDLGPYQALPPTPMPAQLTAGAASTAVARAEPTSTPQDLPDWAFAAGGNSNNWVVDGTRTASGQPLLAGDPHLGLTLPAIWFQLSGDSPGYHFAGVSIPGTPGALIGRNQHIAWSLTNTQNAATFYYREQMDASHPDQYQWRGAWEPIRHVRYEIPVSGRQPEALDVRFTVHGPLVSRGGQTYALYWVGALPSQDITVLLHLWQASTFDQFRAALRDWHAPAQNFAYADDAGHIGVVSAGWYPLVASGEPWLPLNGTGESDVVGSIPYEAVPQVADPAVHMAWTANQRPVTPDYPYYVGTSVNDFDPGYRANEIHRTLSQGQSLTAGDMEALQNADRDFLAGKIVPSLLAAPVSTASTTESRARDLLASWDYGMLRDSPAATIWYTFWNDYVSATFQPWWDAMHVKAPLSSVADGLGQSLEGWTLSDPANTAFTPPGGALRFAPAVMVSAFGQAVHDLSARLGPDPSSWSWGRVHRREIPSLLRISSLGFGPVPSDGDGRTPNAAHGLTSTEGPSWRMVVDFGSGSAYGVYPGGQSENPVSDWYQNRVVTWLDGRYDAIVSADTARSNAGTVTWSLNP
jgi:penicillin amidase